MAEMDYSTRRPISGMNHEELINEILASSAVVGGAGKKYKVVAGVIRNYGNPNYWECITDATHTNINIESVTNDASTITVWYPNLGAGKNISFIAVPDEALIQRGYVMGSSVEVTRAVIQVKPASPVSDYVFFDVPTGLWKANTGKFTSFSFNAGILTVSHEDLYSTQCHDVSITPRGGTYGYRVTSNGGATSSTSVIIEIRDSAGNLVTTPDANMKFFLTHGPTNSPDLNNLNIVGANIWLYGIFEV